MTGHAGFEKPQDCSVTVTLLDAGGVEILSLIHQPCRKFINRPCLAARSAAAQRAAWRSWAWRTPWWRSRTMGAWTLPSGLG
mgnify:CR=1 FL=1